MVDFLANERSIGRPARSGDLQFIVDGAWLKDAAVMDVVSKRMGAWDVYLIFAHFKDPLHLLVRNITRCYSEKKARAVAFYIRKEAAKDRRGTLQVSLSDLDLCTN
jgi:hypothetical protein